MQPGAYPLSEVDLVLELVGAMGRMGYRPAHIHVKIDHVGYRPLTTQVYFPDDPHDETELLGERTSMLLADMSDNDETLRADIALVLDPLPTGSGPMSP